MPRGVTAEDVRALLRKKYAAPEWAFLEEVSNGTGWQKQTRYADGVAMNLWPSRGMDILGFEIKVRRSDWIKELKSPEKSGPIQQFCDHWWIVAPPGVVKSEEVPSTWGLMSVGHGRLMMVKQAPKLESKPLTRTFVAAMLRREAEAANTKVTSSSEYKRGYQEGLSCGKDSSKRQLERIKQELNHLKGSLEDFEREVGIRIDRWNGGHLGKLVKAAQVLQCRDVESALLRAKQPLQLALLALEAVEKIDELT